MTHILPRDPCLVEDAEVIHRKPSEGSVGVEESLQMWTRPLTSSMRVVPAQVPPMPTLRRYLTRGSDITQ